MAVHNMYAWRWAY